MAALSPSCVVNAAALHASKSARTAARRAGSSIVTNRQGWLSPTDGEALATQDEMRAANYARLKLAGLEQAPCHVAVFVDPDPEQGHGLGRRTMPESVAYSAVIAVHTLWLAARAHGIGLGWVSILDPARIRAILEIPKTWQLVAYLCVGYPEIEAITPELEREGWEKRRSINIVVR